MLPHVIITRSYCSPAGLLPPLSWRGSGQGQTGRAGRTETEYYHWGESCFMLPSGRARLPGKHQAGALLERRASCAHTQRPASVGNKFTLPVFFFSSSNKKKTPHHFDHLRTSFDRCAPPSAHPPRRLRGQYLTLPPATLSSVTHGSHSIQMAG